MSNFLKAFIPTLAAGFILVGLFYKWRQNTSPREASADVESIAKMERDGVPAILGFRTLSNEEFSLARVAGKVVVINFWASWCGPCVEEIPSLIELIEKFRGEVQLVAISNDTSEEQMKAFLKAFPGLQNASIHLLWDPQFSIMRSYNVGRLPESFVADRSLKLRKKIVGTIHWTSANALDYFEELVGTRP